MKKWLLLLIGCVLAGPAGAGDWRETLSPPRSGGFAPPRPFEAIYRFGWSGVTAAEADFVLARAPRGQLQLAMTTRTIGLARTLWQMDTKHNALCDAGTLRPIRMQQTETYKDETESHDVVFSAEDVRRKSRVTPQKGPPEKERKVKLANVFDLQTGLFFVRSQRLEAGDRYRFLVFPSTTAYLAEVEVLGRERLKVAAGNFDAIKCAVRLERVGKKFELTPHKKFQRALAWISDDRDRLLLKVDAEIFVGSVWAELRSVKFAPENAQRSTQIPR